MSFERPPSSLENDERSALVERALERGRARDHAIDRSFAKHRGVVHTPSALARFMLKATDEALQHELGLARGLASDGVVIVDPATGPGIFIAAALERAGPRGAPRACIGLDVDEAALRDADEVLAPCARHHGWPLRLVHADALSSSTPVPELADHDVTRVVIGNPPWAARSANRKAEYTEKLLEDFRRDLDGNRLRERRIGVLSDDYIRFLRWSAELVRTAHHGGVLALVTNASFLDGPVHRAMRAVLAQWMDRIDIVDLGGSSLVARSSERDENVFGVRPNVAVTIAVRHPSKEPRKSVLRMATLRGSKGAKLEALSRDTLSYIERPSDGPWIAHQRHSSPHYATWPSLAAWMPFHREGLQTNRDDLVTAKSRQALIAQLETFAQSPVIRATEHWDPDQARIVARELLEDPARWGAYTRKIAYRPFETRVALVHPALCHRPRPKLGRAIDASPFTLITARKDRGRVDWMHFGAARVMPDNCWLSTRSSCRARAFPLSSPDGAPNLDAHLAREASMCLGRALDAATFAHWALAWLSSRVYRASENDALAADYPRIPPPRDLTELELFATHGEAIARAFLDDEENSREHAHDAVSNAPNDSSQGAATLRIGHHDVLPRWLKANPHAGHESVAQLTLRLGRLATALSDADEILGPRIEARLRGDGVEIRHSSWCPPCPTTIA